MMYPAGYAAAGMEPMDENLGDASGGQCDASGAYESGAYGGEFYGDESDYCESCRGKRGGCGHCLLGGYKAGGHGPFGPYEDNACGPRWFDISAEFVYLKREDAGRRVDFASNGIRADSSVPIVLSTADLEFHEEPGIRITGCYDIGAASNLEFTYLGTFFWSASAQATSDTDNLYSVISDFGLSPLGGYVETDQAALQQIDYDSQLDTLELNYRRHWMSPSMRLQGSWLMGIRYAIIDERFIYNTSVEAHVDPLTTDPRGPGFFNNVTKTSNDLVGFQLGGDAWACLLPGLTAGGEVKAGIYGNAARQRTYIVFGDDAPTGSTSETVESNRAAFLAEAGANVVYQLTPAWSIRGGYQVMFIDGIALGPENFNPEVEGLTPGDGGGSSVTRTPFINDNGNAFYHGFTAGFEYLW